MSTEAAAATATASNGTHKRGVDEDVAIEDGSKKLKLTVQQQDAPPQLSVAEKLELVKHELDVQPWPQGLSAPDLIRRMVENHQVQTDSFYIADIGMVIKQFEKWNRLLPNIHPYYAVKCNPSMGILRTLEALGANFDCASRTEIETVLSMGVDPSRIIFANPCKQISSLVFAREKGVRLMTFDNLSELEKIEKYFPEAQLVIRIAPDDSKSLMRFGTKFGVHPEDVAEMLEMAQEMKLEVVGVSFHVGSGCFDAVAYDGALTLVRSVFDQAAKLGMTLSLVDIGGGFSGSDEEMFRQFAEVIKTKRAELFPPSVRFISEPGRYFAAQSHTLAVCVISKRKLKQEDNRQHPRRTSNNRRYYNYYLGDGVYGSFNNIQNDHAKPEPHVLNPSHTTPTPCTLFGPTCDSIDVIARDVQLPELKIGEWLYFPNMGAYTIAAASAFNGFIPPRTYYFSSV